MTKRFLLAVLSATSVPMMVWAQNCPRGQRCQAPVPQVRQAPIIQQQRPVIIQQPPPVQQPVRQYEPPQQQVQQQRPVIQQPVQGNVSRSVNNTPFYGSRSFPQAGGNRDVGIARGPNSPLAGGGTRGSRGFPTSPPLNGERGFPAATRGGGSSLGVAERGDARGFPTIPNRAGTSDYARGAAPVRGFPGGGHNGSAVPNDQKRPAWASRTGTGEQLEGHVTRPSLVSAQNGSGHLGGHGGTGGPVWARGSAGYADAGGGGGGNYGGRGQGSRTFVWPHGFRYTPLIIGASLPVAFLTSQYFVDNFQGYDLPAPAPGDRWVRYGPDMVMVNASTGYIFRVQHSWRAVGDGNGPVVSAWADPEELPGDPPPPVG
jgi:hypothetical protein